MIKAERNIKMKQMDKFVNEQIKKVEQKDKDI